MSGRADWDALWAKERVDRAAVLEEERSVRWRQIEAYVRRRWAGFDGLRVIEVGSGHGTNAIHFARRGAEAVVLDTSSAALEGARRAAELAGTTVTPILGDVLHPPQELLGGFDVSCSFGLCEHFVGGERQAVVASHLAFASEEGVAMISVPNRRSYPYRVWMGFLRWRGTWPMGTEEPFDARELTGRLRAAGGQIEHVGYGSFPGTIVGYSVNPFFHNLGRRGLRPPQWKTPLDPWAYELLVIAGNRA